MRSSCQFWQLIYVGQSSATCHLDSCRSQVEPRSDCQFPQLLQSMHSIWKGKRLQRSLTHKNTYRCCQQPRIARPVAHTLADSASSRLARLCPQGKRPTTSSTLLFQQCAPTVADLSALTARERSNAQEWAHREAASQLPRQMNAKISACIDALAPHGRDCLEVLESMTGPLSGL